MLTIASLQHASPIGSFSRPDKGRDCSMWRRGC